MPAPASQPSVAEAPPKPKRVEVRLCSQCREFIEVEADTLEQVEQALEARPDFILLDNMNPVQLRLAVQKCKGRTLTEASGGVTLGTVRTIAETGVDFVSVGALTHSARAVDIGLDFEP